jgi:hypothetical protein
MSNDLIERHFIVPYLRNHAVYKRHKNCIVLRDAAADEIERLADELDNERARGIHSCGPNCQRITCKQRKRIAELDNYYAKTKVLLDVANKRIDILEAALKGEHQWMT